MPALVTAAAWVLQDNPNVNTDSLGSLLRRDGQRVYGSSVMFRPGSVLVVGGGYAFRDGSGNVQLGQSGSANTTYILTVPLNAASAAIATSPSMAYRRTHADTVLLPDGRVFVHGGQQSGGENGNLNTRQWANTVNPDTLWNLDLAVRTGEILTPPADGNGTGSFALGARSQEERIYHSTAMLLPDGTVLTAGGGGCGTCDQLEPAVYGSLSGLSGSARGERINKKNHEIYYPPYLFKSDGSLAPRPIIQSTSLSPTGTPPYPTVAYDSNFTLTWAHLESDRSIQKVSLIALGAPTHGFDQNQRFWNPILPRAAISSPSAPISAASPSLAGPAIRATPPLRASTCSSSLTTRACRLSPKSFGFSRVCHHNASPTNKLGLAIPSRPVGGSPPPLLSQSWAE